MATATVTVTVTAKPTLTVKADNKSKTYDSGPYPGFSASVTSSETCTTIGTPTFGRTAVAAINRGSYTITVTGVSSPDCTVVHEAGTLDIAPAPLDVVPHDGS